jgi:hypothetical protein
MSPAEMDATLLRICDECEERGGPCDCEGCITAQDRGVEHVCSGCLSEPPVAGETVCPGCRERARESGRCTCGSWKRAGDAHCVGCVAAMDEDAYAAAKELRLEA